MNLSKPNRDVVDVSRDKGARLLSQMIEFYDAIVELGRPLLPSRSPNLKSITLETLADLRRTIGDDAGEKGPRSTVLAGGTENLDALAGVWVWDSTSTLPDDGATVVQVAGVAVGRWRKIPSGGGGGGGSLTAASFSVPYGRNQYAEGSVTDAAISPSSKVLITWGMITDADENTPDMDTVDFVAVPGTGSMIVRVSTADPLAVIGGTYKVMYMVSA